METMKTALTQLIEELNVDSQRMQIFKQLKIL